MSFMNANCSARELPKTFAARRMCCSRFMEFLRLSYYFFVAVLIFSFEFSFLFDVRVLRFFEFGVLIVERWRAVHRRRRRSRRGRGGFV